MMFWNMQYYLHLRGKRIDVYLLQLNWIRCYIEVPSTTDRRSRQKKSDAEKTMFWHKRAFGQAMCCHLPISPCRALGISPLLPWSQLTRERHPSSEGCLLVSRYSGLGESGGGGVGGKGQKSHPTAYTAQAGNTKPSMRLAVANTSVGYCFIASAPKWAVQKANRR